jgi:hypothetical protein
VNAGITNLEAKLHCYERNQKDQELRKEVVKDDYIVGYIQTTHAPLVSSTIQQQERVKAIADQLNGTFSPTSSPSCKTFALSHYRFLTRFLPLSLSLSLSLSLALSLRVV